MEVSESNLIFHDIVIHNDGNQICMDLYSKGYGPARKDMVLLISTILKTV